MKGRSALWHRTEQKTGRGGQALGRGWASNLAKIVDQILEEAVDDVGLVAISWRVEVGGVLYEAQREEAGNSIHGDHHYNAYDVTLTLDVPVVPAATHVKCVPHTRGHRASSAER